MNVLWIPIFSMRSYETGKYAALKDGNFQLTMSRVLASNFDRVFVAIPEDTSDLDELTERFKDTPHVYFTQMKYGANAVATRDFFWVSNADLLKSLEINFDVLISDVTGYTGTKPVVYNFNITKLPELDRPYIDRFFEQDLKSIEQSVFTTVINPRQREYILEARPDLLGKVIVHTKCAHEELLPKHTVWKAGPKTIFWPFRISDKAYQFEQFIAAFEAQGLVDEGYFIFATDPNDTLKIEKPYLSKEKLTKAEYYMMLSACPIIVMLDDIDTVLHPGTIEFFHYGCPVITYESELIDNFNTIPNLDWLGTILRRVVYNRIDTSPFVYSTGEIDSLYNKDFVNVRSN